MIDRLKNFELASLLSLGVLTSSMPAYCQEGQVLDKKAYAQSILEESIGFRLPEKYDTNSLEKKLSDYSTGTPTEFTIKVPVPKILKDYQGKDKDELIKKYTLMWGYEVESTYWVIEDMRQNSENSNNKINLFGLAQYLKDNLEYKIDALDYAVELYQQKKDKPDSKKIMDIAVKTQKAQQISADKCPAPKIGVNPVDYNSKKCIQARAKGIEVKVLDNLKMLRTENGASSVSQLIQQAHNPLEYQEFLADVINTNGEYFDAITDSLSIPKRFFFLSHFISNGVSKESEGAKESVLGLCVRLYNKIFNGNLTEEEMKRFAKQYNKK